MCRDLVLDGAPGTKVMAPTELRLRNLTQLTRLVLKGHVDHFTANKYETGVAPRPRAARAAWALHG